MNEVWIVDDDRSIRWVLEKVLTKAGFTCRSFSDGNAAWTALQNDCPGVLISDIRMPGPNGIDLLTRIKEKYPKLPVIITTAFSDLESAVSAFQKGAFEYLPKPFDASEFLARVRALTRRSSAYTPSRLTLGNTALDCGTYQLRTPYGETRLNNKEYQLMELFLRNPQQVFSSEHLIERI